MTTWITLPLKGKLTGAAAYQQKSQVLAAVDRDARHLQLDLAGVTDIDSTGAQVLADLQHIMNNRFGELKLINVPRHVEDAMAQWKPGEHVEMSGAAPAQAKAKAEPRHAPGSRRVDPAAVRRKRLAIFAAAIVVLLAVVGVQQYRLSRAVVPRPTAEDQRRFGSSNARMVAAVLAEFQRKQKRYPARPEEVQALVQQRRLPLLNPYTQQPLAIVAPGQRQPGALAYANEGGKYLLFPLGPEGQPAK